MKLRGVVFRLCGIVMALAVVAPSGSAQVRDTSRAVTATSAAISRTTMDSFVAAHIAIADLRGKMQAELAEPRSKKVESQAILREKLQSGTEQLLKDHHLTETEFTQLTRRVSTEEAARRQFEEAIAQLTKR